MTFHIDTREAEAATVLCLKGRLTFGEECQSLAAQIRDLVAGGKTRILANVEELTYIDSSGVGELIACFTTVRKTGGAFKLAGPKDHVAEILQLVRLPSVIDVYQDEAAALASFG